jgi:acetamidase/formamidase
MSKAQTFHVSRENAYLKWDNTTPPNLTVDSGSEITFDLLDGGYNQFSEASTSADVPSFDLAKGDPIIGPVYVNEAQPGDVLKVEFLDLSPTTFGWTAVFPKTFNFGLLADEFPDPHLKIWDLQTHRAEGYTVFKEGIHIPIRPFLGVAGVARGEKGAFSTIPPYRTGGNIDCKHITVGSILYLPVEVVGALFSCGDGHAAQGDGEVCGTAIECQMKATVRLTVEKSKSWVQSPHYQTTHLHSKTLGGDKGEYAALGVHEDLREASRIALRGLIDWLVGEKGLSREEGYMLASVAADLKIAVSLCHSLALVPAEDCLLIGND